MFDSDVWTIKNNQTSINEKDKNKNKSKSYSTIKTPFKKKNDSGKSYHKQSNNHGTLETNLALGFNTV